MPTVFEKILHLNLKNLDVQTKTGPGIILLLRPESESLYQNILH